MPDLNAADVDAPVEVIEDGSGMGITVNG